MRRQPKHPSDYLDDLKHQLGIESDYALAKHLGVPKQTVSAIRHRESMGGITASKIATELGINPAEILYASKAANAKVATEQKMWRDL